MDDAKIDRLVEKAWAIRENAHVRGRRRVGAAVLAADGAMYSGCNIQQRYHSGDLHAEQVAIAMMIANGNLAISAIAITSDGDGIAPCGACRDWILEFGGEDCWVIWAGEREGRRTVVRGWDLMPLHPPYS